MPASGRARTEGEVQDDLTAVDGGASTYEQTGCLKAITQAYLEDHQRAAPAPSPGRPRPNRTKPELSPKKAKTSGLCGMAKFLSETKDSVHSCRGLV